MRSLPHFRRGITVLEVLIALGILAIGLASVAAIIPAAGSQGARAVILDRAAVHAANVLADAATFGVLQHSGTGWTSLTASSSNVIIDIAGTSLALTATASLRNSGLYLSNSSGTAPAAANRLLFESRDDITVTPPATDDDPPTNQIVDGARGFEGRMTSLLCLRRTANGQYRASVVVFHGRDPGTTAITGTLSNSALTFTPPADRTAADIVRPGVVLWDQTNGGFHQTMAAALNSNGSAVFVTLGSGTALANSTATVQILPDSVGLAERVFTPETAGGFVP
jgi:Tfp pilus assembly protein PilV